MERERRKRMGGRQNERENKDGTERGEQEKGSVMGGVSKMGEREIWRLK